MRLAEIAEVFSGRPAQKVEEGEPTSLVPVVAMRDVGTRIVARAHLETVSVGGEPDPRRRIQAGDIVVTSRGRVRAAVAHEEHAGVLLGPNLMMIRPQRDYPSALLAAFLRHPAVEARLLADTMTAGTPGFSMENLRSLELNDIPADQADRLAELMDETDTYVREIQAGADRLTAAAIETVFTNLNVEPAA